MLFLSLLFIPLTLSILSFLYLKTISWKELALHTLLQVIVAGISAGILYWQNTTDYETWSGRVTDKQQVRVPCSHSYQCNCRPQESCSGSGKDRSCTTTTVCDTCYEHLNDWNWNVYTSNKEVVTIARVDRRGTYAPPRWSVVRINEPTALTHSYTNYIKAAPDTLFRHQGLTEKYTGKIPRYPSDVYDYYKLDRLVTQGIVVPNRSVWNEGLQNINAELGAKKQVNMIVVLTDQPQEWFFALEEAWIGGKKNDAVLVIGVDERSGKANWASVMAWSTDEMFEIKLRDDVMALPRLAPEDVLGVLKTNVSNYYKRKPMAEFEYLRASIKPSWIGLSISLVIGLLISGILVIVFHKHDVFG